MMFGKCSKKINEVVTNLSVIPALTLTLTLTLTKRLGYLSHGKDFIIIFKNVSIKKQTSKNHQKSITHTKNMNLCSSASN